MKHKLNGITRYTPFCKLELLPTFVLPFFIFMAQCHDKAAHIFNIQTKVSFSELRFLHYLETHVYQPYARLMFWAVFLFIGFSISDYFVLGTGALKTVLFRAIAACFIGFSLHVATRKRWQHLKVAEVATLILFGWLVNWVGNLALEQGNSHYQSGVILIILYVGTFSRLSTWSSVFSITFVLVPYLIWLSPKLYAIDPMQEFDKLTIIFTTSLMCIVSSYRRELEMRYNFTQSQEIRRQAIRLNAYSKKMKRRSETDGLTGLSNRHYFNRYLKKHPVMPLGAAVLMIDIDHFKLVNDQFGHSVGDTTIRGIARIIQALDVDEAVKIRYGGEEFMIVLPSTHNIDVADVAEKLRIAVENSNLISHHSVTVSIGVFQTKDSETPLVRGISLADKALYKAKLDGRNRLVSWQTQ